MEKKSLTNRNLSAYIIHNKSLSVSLLLTF